MSKSMAETLGRDPKDASIPIESITSHSYELNLALGYHKAVDNYNNRTPQ